MQLTFYLLFLFILFLMNNNEMYVHNYIYVKSKTFVGAIYIT